jgi:hypothetical protein
MRLSRTSGWGVDMAASTCEVFSAYKEVNFWVLIAKEQGFSSPLNAAGTRA